MADLNNTQEQAPTNIPEMSELKTIFLNNFSKKEISLILSAVKRLFPQDERKKLVFARATEQSLKMTVKEWIEDTAEDHLYLLENPPTLEQKELANQSNQDENL